MNNSKHIKGPWRTGVYTTTNKCFVADEGGSVLCEFQTASIGFNEVDERARLIASAPELLSVARELEFLIKKYDVGAIPMRLRQDLKNAITKATGGSNE